MRDRWEPYPHALILSQSLYDSFNSHAWKSTWELNPDNFTAIDTTKRAFICSINLPAKDATTYYVIALTSATENVIVKLTFIKNRPNHILLIIKIIAAIIFGVIIPHYIDD